MSESTITGLQPRTNTEASQSNSSDDGSCATCRADADGIDARTFKPICSGCAARSFDDGRSVRGGEKA